MRLILTAIIRVYKTCISPMLPVACRFTPTCSDYAHDAVTRHGAFHGGLMALKRLLRCHPFAGAGFDPVPCSCGDSHAEK